MSYFQVIVVLLIAHFLADFCLQTSEQAANKHNNLMALCEHGLTYSAVMTGLFAGLFNFTVVAIVYGLLNGAYHTVIDFFTSKLTHKFYEKKDYHNMFVVVGADQLLHVLIIIGYVKILMSE